MKPTRIYAEMIDSIALEQFENAMSLTCNVQGALMPDAHAGYTLPIGAVIKSKQMVFPSYVGYDIGCGMCAVKLDICKEDIENERLKKEIIKAIPLGMSRHQTKQPYVPLTCTPKAQEMFDEIGAYQLGTLGGGNHFIELGSGNDGKVWIVIHSGSRGFGKNIAEYYMKLAAMSHVPTDEWREAFEKSHVDFKKHNPEKYEIALASYLEKQKASIAKTHLEKHVGFSITSREGKEYLLDMECALAFALENRKRMIDSIISLLGNPKELLFINRNHNHAEIKGEFVIHRKGATHAEEGMLGVIPGNMRDGSFIVKGKGNEASLCSSSHGAGRVLSRNQAFMALNVDQFHNDMQGICTNHTDKMLDESPRAYKDIFEVMALQKELVDVIDHVKPFLNIKGQSTVRLCHVSFAVAKRIHALRDKGEGVVMAFRIEYQKAIDGQIEIAFHGTQSYNINVYEFTPLTDPGATCIMSFTNEKMGMFCFPKTDKAITKSKQHKGIC